MTRRRYIQLGPGEYMEVTPDYSQPPAAPTVRGDLPAYQSPIDGKCIEGRAQRRNDLARAGCRPWEGLEAEKKEAARQRQYQEQRNEAKLTEAVWRSYYELSPEKRAIVRGAR